MRRNLRYCRGAMSQTTERFELQTRIAIGNAGLVYRAVENATRRRVALKLLNEDLSHPLDGAALAREAARVRRTAGNNIAQFLEVIDDEAGVVLVAEYADGVSWTQAAGERRLDGAQAVDVAAQLLSALAVGEAIKVPHGELKPGNLVLGELPGGRLFVWVLDWGLSAFRKEPPLDALLWMPPERLAGGEATITADLFAAGACLCWLLTGKLPVLGQTREELAAAWRQFPADALHQVRPDLPVKFTRWVAGLLEINPKARFATVQQARAALAPLQPPAAPVLPEIFRPRPKAPHSTVTAPAKSGILAPVARAAPVARVAVAKVVAVPVPVPRAVAVEPTPMVATAPLAAAAAVAPVAVIAAVELAAVTEIAQPSRKPWRWMSIGVASSLAVVAATWLFLHRAGVPARLSETPPALAATPPAGAPTPAAPTVKVIAEERFSYAAGTALQGQRGGAGWAGPWIAPGLTVRAASLSAGHIAPSGTGGHVALEGAPELAMHRPLGPRALFLDEAKGGTWWVSLVVAHFAPPGEAKGGELRCNFFNETVVGAIARLKLTPAATGLTAMLGSSPKPVVLPGAAAEPKRLLLRISAVPAQPGKFDLTLDLWANPQPAAFRAAPPKPALSVGVRQAAFPPKLGVLVQKSKAAGTTTTLLDDLRFGRQAGDVLD